MPSTTTIIAALFALVAIGLFLAVCLINADPFGDIEPTFGKNTDLKHYARNRDEDAPRWFLGIVVGCGLITLVSWLSQRDEAHLAGGTPQRITMNLADCPAPLPGDAEVLLFIVATTADGTARPPQCVRIAERGWVRTRPQLDHMAGAQ